MNSFLKHLLYLKKKWKRKCISKFKGVKRFEMNMFIIMCFLTKQRCGGSLVSRMCIPTYLCTYLFSHSHTYYIFCLLMFLCICLPTYLFMTCYLSTTYHTQKYIVEVIQKIIINLFCARIHNCYFLEKNHFPPKNIC
jgi:hypothetical protein